MTSNQQPCWTSRRRRTKKRASSIAGLLSETSPSTLMTTRNWSPYIVLRTRREQSKMCTFSRCAAPGRDTTTRSSIFSTCTLNIVRADTHRRRRQTTTLRGRISLQRPALLSAPRRPPPAGRSGLRQTLLLGRLHSATHQWLLKDAASFTCLCYQLRVIWSDLLLRAFGRASSQT